MRVELDMFSGRPNPTWDLDDMAERELLALESNLQPSGRLRNEPPPLGYRGFAYGDASARRRVFDGIVSVAGRAYEDPKRNIERLLIASIPNALQALREHLPDLPGG